MPNRESSRTSSRARVCALLLLVGLWSAGAQAQMCGDTFLVNASPSDLVQIDTSTNPWTFAVLGNADVQLNALAFRPPPDNALYAIQAPGNTLVQVNLDGSVDVVGAVNGLPTQSGSYHVGAFAPDGLMYVRSTQNTTTMYAIDVDATPPTATPLNLSASVNFADVALVDGLFYGVTNQGLVSVDPVTGTVDTIGGPFAGGFGAMIPASNGVFGLRNADGLIFQFDITTGEGVQVAQGDPTGNVDGARCFEAVLEFETDLSVTKDDGSGTYLPGRDVVYEIVVTNNGPFGVQNAEVSDPLPDGITTASWTCTGGGGGVCGADSGDGAIIDTPDLEVGASVTYELTITVPGDHTGELVNTVTVELPEGFIDPMPEDNTATDVDQSEFEPGITLEKAGSGPDPLELGSTIEYKFLVTNVGNVPLTDVTLTDPLPGMSPIDCPDDTLEPKAEMTCTANYTVTQEDVDAGVIENTATVTGQPPGDQPLVEDEASAVFPPEQGPGISMEKSGSGPDPLTVGATVNYEFLVANTGNVTLTNVTVTDPLPGLSPISCPETTLAPGAEMTCTATYEVTQADVEAGVIENTATATGETPTGGPPPTDESTATVPPIPPVPSLPPLAFVVLAALLATATLWTLRRARV